MSMKENDSLNKTEIGLIVKIKEMAKCLFRNTHSHFLWNVWIQALSIFIAQYMAKKVLVMIPGDFKFLKARFLVSDGFLSMQN